MLLFGSILEFRLFTFGFLLFFFGFSGLLIRFCGSFLWIPVRWFHLFIVNGKHPVSCKAGFRLGFHHFYFAGISF